MQQPLIDIDFTLSDAEVRVLGVLMEKQVTTPAYYPMSPNALTNGCNQKNSRHPVLSYTESQVMGTLEGMRDRRLVSVVHEHGSRVPKYAQLLTRELRLEPDEHAVLCVLMLRGAQTIGELRGRCDPMHSFPSLEAVEQTLNTLAARPVKALVVKLERLPGARDARWAHTLMGAEGIAAMQADFVGSGVSAVSAPSLEPGRLEALENELRTLRDEVPTLRDEVHTLRAELDEIKRQLGI